MWDRWAFPVAGTRSWTLSYRCSIYGMDIRVSRYGGGPPVGRARRPPVGRQLVRSTSVPVPENRRPSCVVVTLSSVMVDGSPSIVRS